MKEVETKIEDWSEVEEPELEREDVTYVKWDSEGTEVVGELVEMFTSKDGTKYAKVDTGDELKTMFSIPTLLEGKLKGQEGNDVKIVYLGQTRTFQSGRKGKDFKVFVRKKEGNSPSPSDKVEAFLD
jgi:hypothetical protein